jgi:hypothetical protein
MPRKGPGRLARPGGPPADPEGPPTPAIPEGGGLPSLRSIYGPLGVVASVPARGHDQGENLVVPAPMPRPPADLVYLSAAGGRRHSSRARGAAVAHIPADARGKLR